MNDTELRDHFAALAMAAFINEADTELTWKQMCRLLGYDEKEIPTTQRWLDAAVRYRACMAYRQAEAMMVERRIHPEYKSMTSANLPDDSSYRSQQDQEAAKFVYTVDVIIRLRARQLTDQDVNFIEYELLPNSTQPRNLNHA